MRPETIIKYTTKPNGISKRTLALGYINALKRRHQSHVYEIVREMMDLLKKERTDDKNEYLSVVNMVNDGFNENDITHVSYHYYLPLEMGKEALKMIHEVINKCEMLYEDTIREKVELHSGQYCTAKEKQIHQDLHFGRSPNDEGPTKPGVYLDLGNASSMTYGKDIKLITPKSEKELIHIILMAKLDFEEVINTLSNRTEYDRVVVSRDYHPTIQKFLNKKRIREDYAQYLLPMTN